MHCRNRVSTASRDTERPAHQIDRPVPSAFRYEAKLGFHPNRFALSCEVVQQPCLVGFANQFPDDRAEILNGAFLEDQLGDAHLSSSLNQSFIYKP